MNWGVTHTNNSFLGGVSGKEPTCHCRDETDTAVVLGSGRSPGGGNGNPLQYSCLGNPIDRKESGRLQFPGSQSVRHDLVPNNNNITLLNEVSWTLSFYSRKN